MKDVPDGATSESEPIPLVGGPYDGAVRSYTTLFPFLDGGIPSSILVVHGHQYELAKDRTKWEYRGVAKGQVR